MIMAEPKPCIAACMPMLLAVRGAKRERYLQVTGSVPDVNAALDHRRNVCGLKFPGTAVQFQVLQEARGSSLTQALRSHQLQVLWVTLLQTLLVHL